MEELGLQPPKRRTTAENLKILSEMNSLARGGDPTTQHLEMISEEKPEDIRNPSEDLLETEAAPM